MILHIDMDAFFASVEQLDNPELIGTCLVVGWDSPRGVVAAASYEARKYGVRSAMPIFMAKQKCPRLVIVSPNRRRYQEISNRVMDILMAFSPLVEPVSIDEAYMDVEGCERLFGSAEQIAAAIKKRIRDEIGLTCSVGIAPNRFLAKIASDLDKPDGMTFLRPEMAGEFIDTLPVEKVPGVGEVTHGKLSQMGIQTLGDVKRFPEAMLIKRLGKFGSRLHELSLGIDETPITPHTPAKSISSEETLSEDTDNRSLLKTYLLNQSEDVGRQLRKSRLRARTINIKIKHADFRQATRSETIHVPTCSSETIYREAEKLLAAYPLTRKVRLIGVGVSGLVSAGTPVQMDLFSGPRKQGMKWEKVDSAVDSIREKFGKNMIKKAKLSTER